MCISIRLHILCAQSPSEKSGKSQQILFSKRKFHLSASKIRVGKLFALKFVIKRLFTKLQRVFFFGSNFVCLQTQREGMNLIFRDGTDTVAEFGVVFRLWNWTWYQFKLINYAISCVSLGSAVRRALSNGKDLGKARKHKPDFLWWKSLKNHKLKLFKISD